MLTILQVSQLVVDYFQTLRLCQSSGNRLCYYTLLSIIWTVLYCRKSFIALIMARERQLTKIRETIITLKSVGLSFRDIDVF